jgi:hypothetical protein
MQFVHKLNAQADRTPPDTRRFLLMLGKAVRWEEDEMFATEPRQQQQLQPQQQQEATAAPQGRVLRLFDMAQIKSAEMVTIRNVLPLLDWADMSRANLVKDVCLQVRSR